MKEINRNALQDKKVIKKRDIKKLKLEKNNNFTSRTYVPKRTFKKNIVLPIAFGIVFLCGTNLFKVEGEVVAKDLESSSVTNEDDKELNKKHNNNYDYFLVGSSSDKSKVIDFLYGPLGQIVYKYSEMYGVDPNVIAAMCMQESSLMHNECIPGGSKYYGYGVGIMQLESPSGQEISAYNYLTGQFDTEYITMDNACNMEMNIKIGCMIFQNSLKSNYGNILLAIQSHNYGQPMLDLILEQEYSGAVSSIKQDYEDLEWIKDVKTAHEDPQKYLFDWDEDSYGDGNYISNVLKYCPSDKVTYNYNGCKYTFDLKNLKIIKIEELGTKIK